MSFRKILFTVFAVVMLMSLSVGIAACTPKTRTNESGDTGTSDPTSVETSTSEPEEEAEDLIVVNGVSPNANFSLRETAKTEKSEANKESEFIDRDQEFVVGDDNAFVVKPSVAFLIFKGNSNEAETYVPDEWTYCMNVYRFVNKTYVALNEEDYATFIEAFDATNATVDFTEDAIGEQFKIEVYPDGLLGSQIEDADYRETVEVKVVDGYNAYTARDLAYIEQGGRDEATYLNEAWRRYKTEKGISMDYAPAAVIMQTNIYITGADLPAEATWHDYEEKISPSASDYNEVVGSLKDYSSLYSRAMGVNDRFTLEGNYFSLNISTLPLVVRFNDEISAPGQSHESHASLFRFTSTDAIAVAADAADAQDGTGNLATFRNINFVGNAPRTENTQLSGGVILLKSNKVAFNAYNNISNSFVINYMGERSNRPFYLTKCRMYDAFTTLVYIYGNSNAVIRDSDINGAGGPAMIIDHVNPLKDPEKGPTYVSSMTVINSEIHSFVTGQEAWFSLHSATTAAGIISAMDEAFNAQGGKAFTKVKQADENTTMKFLDFVALYKSSTAEGITGEKVTGYYKQGADDAAIANYDPANGGEIAMDFGTFDAENKYPWTEFANSQLAGTIEYIVTQVNSLAPIFMSSKGGLAIWSPADESMLGQALYNSEVTYTAGGYLVDLTSNLITDPNNPIFSGDRLYLFYSRMGLVFNYYDAEN